MKLYEKLGRIFLPVSLENKFCSTVSTFSESTSCFLYPSQRIVVDNSIGFAKLAPFFEDDIPEGDSLTSCPSFFLIQDFFECYFFMENKWYSLPARLLQAFTVMEWAANLYIFLVRIGYDN